MICHRGLLVGGLLLFLTGWIPTVTFADSFSELADRLIQKNEPGQLLEQQRQQFLELSERQGPQDEAVQKAAGLLGTLELLLGHPREATAVLQPVVEQLARADQPASALAAHLFNEMGVACYQLAQYDHAHTWLHRAWIIRKAELGEIHVDTLQSVRNLAWAEEALGHREKSQQLFQECRNGLIKVVEQSDIPEPGSSEAVPLLDTRPPYPQIKLKLTSAAPALPTDQTDPPDRNDLKGWVAAQERLSTVLLQLNEKHSIAGEAAAEWAANAYGEHHFKTFLVLANTRPFISFRPDLLPASLGWRHPFMASVLLRRAMAEMDLQKMRSRFESDSLRDLQTAEEIRREAFGERHPLVADVHDARGIFLQTQGQLESALLEFEKSLALRKEHFPADHPQVARSLAALGVVQFARGEVALSRRALHTALEINRRQLGFSAVETATVSSDVAAVAREQGDYALARSILEEAVQTLLQTKGPKDFDTKTALTNLAVVQAELGDLNNSAKYFESIATGDSPDFEKDQALVNLAVIQRFRGQPREAEKLLKSVLQRNNNHIDAQLQLGAVYRDLGDLQQASNLLINVGKTQTNLLEKAHTMRSLGLLSLEQNHFDIATQCFEFCLDVYRRQLGSTSRYTAEALRQLGTACLLSQDFPKARQYLEEAIAIKARWADEQLPYLAEADAVHFAASLGELDPLLSISRLDPSTSPAQAYQAVWTVKSAATRAMIARRASSPTLPGQESLFSKLQSVRIKLASLVQSREIRTSDWVPLREENEPESRLGRFGKSAPTRQQFENQVRELTLQKEQIERDLARKNPAFQYQHRQMSGTPEELRKLLPKNVAVVDIVKTKAWRRNSMQKIQTEPETIYEAFILRSSADEKASDYARVELGLAEPIDQEITRWRSHFAVAGGARGITFETSPDQTADQSASAQALRQAIWEKLSPELEGIDICLLIPDGKIAQIPLGALPGPQPGSFLAEQISFVIAGFGQQILSLLESPAVPPGETLLVGGVAFDSHPSDIVASDETTELTRAYRAPTDETLRGGWGPLPGTRQEVQQIQTLWKGTTHLLSGESATKKALIRRLPECRYVHLATHGFFSHEPVDSVLAVRGQQTTLNGLPFHQKAGEKFDLSTLAETIVGRNPLVLSGIVLAGANSSTEGLLTAEELVDLDLSRIELVTLSACETGLGATAGGEGVFGLQRAFALAGARSSLASLWKVDDDATTALMAEFYRNLWKEKKSRAESLRAAQLRMLKGELKGSGTRKNSQPVSPYYWAAFVLSGDWR